MAAQLTASTDTAATGVSASNSTDGDSPAESAVNTLDELDEAESSMEEDEEQGGGTGAAAAGSSAVGARHAASNVSFAAVCGDQLQKQGLLGALVAAAYPDRIAQLKPGGSGGSRASYSLSSGETPLMHLQLACKGKKIEWLGDGDASNRCQGKYYTEVSFI